MNLTPYFHAIILDINHTGMTNQPKLFGKKLLLLLFFLAYSGPAWEQGIVSRAKIDSLLTLLPAAREDSNKVNLLNALSYTYAYLSPDSGLQYGRQALELARKLSWPLGMAASNYAIGGCYQRKANYAMALDYEYQALKVYEQLNNLPKQALMLRNLGVVYHTSKNQPKALEYGMKSLSIYETLKDSNGIAGVYCNLANANYTLRNTDKVLEYNFKALHLYEATKNLAGAATTLGNLANIYAEEQQYALAMKYYFKTLRSEHAIGNKNGVVRNLGNIGETYLDIYKTPAGKIKPDSLILESRKANLAKALYYLETAVTEAKAIQQIEYVMAFEEVLSEAYLLSGSPARALEAYKSFILTRDSVYDLEKFNALARKELEYEYGKREDSIKYEKQLADLNLSVEKRSRNRDRTFYTAGLVLVLLFLGLMFNRWRVTQRQKKIIEKEKKRSDDLLLNILPAEVAEELKQTGIAKAKNFDQVTVLFTDFKDFSQTSERLEPEELVKEINYCFSEFDKIITRFGIEKIKTIGDSYMCAGGLPVVNQSHAYDVVAAGIAIQQFIEKYKQERASLNQPYFELRIGIHTGPVVAGIVGIKKFAYDIWGDTVNTASRMETGGEVGKVNISVTTYEWVKDRFRCSYRGKIDVKHKGQIDMYFVEEEVIG